LNARLSQSGWPIIAEKQEPMGDKDDDNSKRELLDEGPFQG